MLNKADIFYILIRKWGKFKITVVPKHHARKVRGMEVKLHRFFNLGIWWMWAVIFILLSVYYTSISRDQF